MPTNEIFLYTIKEVYGRLVKSLIEQKLITRVIFPLIHQTKLRPLPKHCLQPHSHN